jgi:hypothetical protein
MAGPASLYPQYMTLTSQVYSGHDADGLQEVFIAQLIPTLTAQLNSTNLVLTWTAVTNIVLQQSADVSPTHWTSVAGTLGTGKFTVTNVSSKATTFYRLATH